MKQANFKPKNSYYYFIVVFSLVVIYCVSLFLYPFVYAGKLNVSNVPERKQTISLKNSELLSADSLISPVYKIAVIGDSTALGQGAESVENSFSFQYTQKYILPLNNQIEYINFAVSGNKVEDVLNSQLPELLASSYDLIFVSIGANNIIDPNYSLENYKESVQKLAFKMVQTKSKIIWVSVPDFITSPILLPPLNHFLSNRTRAFNDITKKILEKYQIRLIDTYNKAREPFFKDPNKYFSVDKYHPSKSGYGLWVEIIKDEQ